MSLGNYDSWLEQVYQDAYSDEEQADNQYDAEYSHIENCIKLDKPIHYGIGNKYTTTIECCDFYDKVFGKQKEIMQLIQSKNKDALFELMQDIYDQEIDSIIDMTIGCSRRK